MSTEAIEVESALVKYEHAGPLDVSPEAFRSGLDRRKENRKSLMDWIRSALVEGVDFGSIPTKRGPSKPSLWKPGAEKICGMLGVTVAFPTLCEYEQVALKGIEIKSVVLRCHLSDARGVIVAEGVGARSLAQDYGDLNKALKMAEKSAHIDATLRMAGLSELFSQDLEDLPKDKQAAIQPQGRSGPPSRQGPPPQKNVATPPVKPQVPSSPPKPKCGGPKARDWMIEKLQARPGEAGYNLVTDYFKAVGQILPTEQLTELPFRFVAVDMDEIKALRSRLAEFERGERAEKAFEPHEEPERPVAKATTEAKPATDDAWKSFPMPWGKQAGVLLGALDKPYLFGLWANYQVETEFKGKPKKPETIAKDRTFRGMLDLAGAHHGFAEKKQPHEEDQGQAEAEAAGAREEEESDSVPF